MDVDEQITLVAERERFLDVLTEGPMSPRDVVDDLDASRSTVNRALNDLTEAGLVERTSDGYATTLAGRLALDRHRAYREEVTGALDAKPALDPLDATAELPVDPLVGASVFRGDDRTPYRPAEQLHDAVGGADRYRALLPALDDPRHVRLCYEHVMTSGNPATIVVTEELAASLAERFPRRLAEMAEVDRFELLAGDVPPFGVALTEGAEASVSVVVFADSGVHAVIRNDAERAVDWARELFADVASDGTDVTDDLRQGDG